MSGTPNTKGVVKGEVASSGQPAAQANPPVDDRNLLERAQDWTKSAIDDWVERQGYSTTAMVTGAVATALAEVFMPTSYWELIPVGKGVGIIKKGAVAFGVIKKGEQAVEATAAVNKVARAEQKVVHGAANKGARKKAAADAKQEGKRKADRGKDTQVKQRRAPKAKPKCFGGKQTKKNPQEYDRQLQQQEDALNNMSVSEYLKNRERWGQMQRMGTKAEQAAARTKAIADMAKTNKDALLAQGMSVKEASTLGKQQAEAAANGLDVLHSPDLSAGGSAQGTTGLGDKGVNRSIGSNWGQNQDASGVGDRVRTMDESADKVPKAERDKTKMNVKLKRCP